jgi:DNA-3-methyladenine glycosylase
VILPELLSGDALAVAPRLLGSLIEDTESGVVIRILETEAYHQHDPASHSFHGPTTRTQAMFGAAGHWYAYFTYGMHWCLNVVTGEPGDGQAVLLRAGEVLIGLDVVLALRNNPTGLRCPERQAIDGPAKLAQALSVNRTDNGTSSAEGRLRLVPAAETLPIERTTSRVGISKGVELPWRFCAPGAPRRAPDRTASRIDRIDRI